MRDFAIITISSIFVIFISVFFIHFTLNNLFVMTEMCSVNSGPSCESASMFLILIFTFLLVLAFIVVIETTIYYIFRGLEMGMLAEMSTSKKSTKNMSELKKRLREIKKAKNDARKKYFRREIEEKTYNDMKDRYDKELMEAEYELKKLKLRMLSK